MDKVTQEFKVHDKLTSDDKTKLFELVQLAHHKHSQHDDRGAEEIYSKVLEADPLDFECLTNLGKISYSRGDLNKARELFEKVACETHTPPPRKHILMACRSGNLRGY